MNDPVPRLGLRREVPNVLGNAVVADGFEKPAASILVSAKRRLRWQLMLCHASPCAHFCCDQRSIPISKGSASRQYERRIRGGSGQTQPLRSHDVQVAFICDALMCLAAALDAVLGFSAVIRKLPEDLVIACGRRPGSDAGSQANGLPELVSMCHVRSCSIRRLAQWSQAQTV